MDGKGMLNTAKDTNIDYWLLFQKFGKIFLIYCILAIFVNGIFELLCSKLLMDELDFLQQNGKSN